MFLATNAYMDIQQGIYSVSSPNRISIGGSGSDESFSASALIITGLWTFDRDPLAPFAVTSSSAVVTNLDADLLDGQHGSYYLARANHTGTQAASTVTAPGSTTQVVFNDAGALAG